MERNATQRKATKKRTSRIPENRFASCDGVYGYCSRSEYKCTRTVHRLQYVRAAQQLQPNYSQIMDAIAVNRRERAAMPIRAASASTSASRNLCTALRRIAGRKRRAAQRRATLSIRAKRREPLTQLHSTLLYSSRTLRSSDKPRGRNVLHTETFCTALPLPLLTLPVPTA